MKRQEVSNKKSVYPDWYDYRNSCNYKTVNAVYILVNEKIQKI